MENGGVDTDAHSYIVVPVRSFYAPSQASFPPPPPNYKDNNNTFI